MPDDPDPPSSNWKSATEAIGPTCPYCGADSRSIDRDGPDWVCSCCSRRWRALEEAAITGVSTEQRICTIVTLIRELQAELAVLRRRQIDEEAQESNR